MSHGFETQNDTMFSVKTRPWHSLGTVIEQAPTISEGIRLAGLDWEVGLKPLFTAIPEGEGVPRIVDEPVPANATYNKKSGEILGVVGPSYTPLQNQQSFDFFQPFLDEGLATLETAGGLFGGKKIWVMAKLKMDNAVIVSRANDEIEKFVLLSNSHDGSTSVRVGFTPIRVVCNNTLSMAHKNGQSSLIKVRHGKGVVHNLEKLRETMNLVNQQFEATAEQYRYLASRDISQEDLKKYVNIVFNLERDESQFNDTRQAGRILPQVQELFETGRGNHLPGVAGTKWAAYNAVTEYLQYYRGNSHEQRFNSVWFNDGARLSRRALETALTL